MPIGDLAQKLVTTALEEHRVFAGVHETDPRLRKRIYDTYLKELSQADPNDALGWDMPANITQWAWSATFVSWCVLKAGASGRQFDFSIRHAMYIKQAIKNFDDGATDAFVARRINDYKPQLGDLIAANRDNGRITFDQARDRESYNSHTAIVVEFIRRDNKDYAVTIGGNESDSVRRTEVELKASGHVRQRNVNPYIAVLQCPAEDAGGGIAPAEARPAARAGAQLSEAFRKHGTFIYEVERTIADYGSSDDAIAAMKRAGMQHAWLRIHGTEPHDAATKRATKAFITALKGAGIYVAGWGWCQGETPARDAQMALRELADHGLTDYVADIEPGHHNSVWTAAEIDSFCGALRSGVRGSFAVSSFALVDWHEPRIMAAALPHIDAWAPQIYWFNYPNARMVRDFRRPDGGRYAAGDPSSYAALCLDRWARLSMLAPKPLILTGQAYWGEGGFGEQQANAKLRDFLRDFTGYDRVAGLNWWHFGGGTAMNHTMFEAIVAARLDGKPYD